MLFFFQRMMVLVFASTALLVQAQDDFRPGVIVTMDDETISGYIDNSSAQLLANRCLFKKMKAMTIRSIFQDT